MQWGTKPACESLDAAPDYVVPAAVSFVASDAQVAPKAVETKADLAELMLRVDLEIDPKVVATYYGKVETGLRGEDSSAEAGFEMAGPIASQAAACASCAGAYARSSASRAGGRPRIRVYRRSLRTLGASRRADVRGCSCACRRSV